MGKASEAGSVGRVEDKGSNDMQSRASIRREVDIIDDDVDDFETLDEGKADSPPQNMSTRRMHPVMQKKTVEGSKVNEATVQRSPKSKHRVGAVAGRGKRKRSAAETIDKPLATKKPRKPKPRRGSINMVVEQAQESGLTVRGTRKLAPRKK